MRVERLYLDRARLEQQLVRSSFLKTGKRWEVPICVSDRTSDFKFIFQERGLTSQKVDATAGAVYENTKSAILTANEGYRYGLADGAVALQDLLFNLPLRELQLLRTALKNGEQLMFVNEVLVYDSASLKVTLADDLSEDLTVDLFGWLGVEAKVSWDENNDLDIIYPPNSIVGYEGTLLDESHLVELEETIAERKEKGDLMIMYEDKDGDGYGSGEPEEYWIFGAKERPERIVGGQVLRYVSNHDDTSDLSEKRMPGEQSWYRDADGDGFGDPSVVTIAKDRPEGYVNNDKDCYDNNARAFPGQSDYFTEHRGDGSFDYDCDNTISVQYNLVGGGCVNSCKSLNSGWDAREYPPPGQAGRYVVGCNNGHWPDYSCTVKRERRVQGGR
ncbi:hypothetical protein SAMN05444359_11268 [Neolewinella agarilytica]|uniref:Uncharacterized protein n=2 Tax=Neolewinella agarilytica TaxID=478744 RepID=A0A1H9H992_9BACT|nr:hypothetical protein SAMN05444359_11268 [Neolewinella agarilytica]